MSGGAGGAFFSCHVKKMDGAVCLVLSGELDLSNATAFRADASTTARLNGGIVFDLTRLRYLDSSGINVPLDTQRRLPGENQGALIGPSSMVRRVLGVLNIERLVSVFSTLDEPRHTSGRIVPMNNLSLVRDNQRDCSLYHLLLPSSLATSRHARFVESFGKSNP